MRLEITLLSPDYHCRLLLADFAVVRVGLPEHSALLLNREGDLHFLGTTLQLLLQLADEGGRQIDLDGLLVEAVDVDADYQHDDAQGDPDLRAARLLHPQLRLLEFQARVLHLLVHLRQGCLLRHLGLAPAAEHLGLLELRVLVLQLLEFAGCQAVHDFLLVPELLGLEPVLQPLHLLGGFLRHPLVFLDFGFLVRLVEVEEALDRLDELAAHLVAVLGAEDALQPGRVDEQVGLGVLLRNITHYYLILPHA